MIFSSIAHAMGGAPGGANAGGAAGMMNAILPFVLIIGVFYFLLIRPQQRKAKETRAMQGNLKAGDAVMTSSGFFGRITDVQGDVATVDLGGMQVKVTRSALNLLPPDQNIVPKAPSKRSKKSKEVEEVEDEE